MKETITQKFLETAIMLSRIYGVAETLEPLPAIPQEKLTPMICDWTAEYLQSNGDMTDFLYKKIKGLH